ncbi:MAG: L-cysteine:1D-myo-inosityl 2-amino-2-deoxy-alpha-D-glucopyranoside ligase MshC [uncultured Nocardioidaceae bacterium]|uniref:L-cysteine:1D-myo-inositol 2-amino-2-deoxy-alpha-D-glucopyranoside ligase n=1 Tax=uncultured Nocardioidaceae bacterium TaxID=253824 RepID=A0A6J4MX68_9ACTN|nr:MAG: L-cysteine:1D-myo-inosityl 2-amino-2-deoxy-alpha-D-glucopyranoside ligase MshC [uncultured Nocardioidaceae bacterium]
MRSWPSPRHPTTVRDALGDAPELSLYDRRSGQVEKTRPADEARLYVCGITPYDATHLGHAATYVAFDLVVRAWREAGHQVRYVQNVTDVDDPLLERARATGEDWMALAERETQLFRDDMAALGVLAPDVYAGAVESIPLIVDLIGQLDARGAVYDVDGDLYFSVAADPAFGEVSGMTRHDMLPLFGENGGDPDRQGKRDPLDSLLWQRWRPGEPGWESPFGVGRPGWHVECAAIATHHLGVGFDLQGGGSDLIFPHHEMSAAASRVAFPGTEFAHSYAHQGMVGLRGAKMSKSLGNLVLASDLRRDGVDPRAVRLGLLAHHYRTDWDWTDETLTAGVERLQRWDAAVHRGGPDARATAATVRGSLADDLDAPAALAAVDAWAADSAEVVDGAADLLAATVEVSLGVSLGS